MNKTIIVGVGGTGLQAIMALRKLVVESYGDLDAEEVKSLGFLYLDTDPSEVSANRDTRGKWKVLGNSIDLSSAEYKIMQAPSIGNVVEDMDSYPHIKEWFPLEGLNSISMTAKDTPGASQIRPLGRFIFTMCAGEVESSFITTLKRTGQKDGGGKTQVYIICSISGGTGSGMFLDLAYMIKSIEKDAVLSAFLVMPDMTTNRGERYAVNAYAALLELNYYFCCGDFDYKGQKRRYNSSARARAI